MGNGGTVIVLPGPGLNLAAVLENPTAICVLAMVSSNLPIGAARRFVPQLAERVL